LKLFEDVIGLSFVLEVEEGDFVGSYIMRGLDLPTSVSKESLKLLQTGFLFYFLFFVVRDQLCDSL